MKRKELFASKHQCAITIIVIVFILASLNECFAQSLSMAAWKGDISKVTKLISKGVDVNLKDDEGRTALSMASSKGRTDIVELLIDNGADINVIDSDGNTPLLDAVLEYHFETAKLLIDRGADFYAENYAGTTVLNSTGNLELVKYVISKGADVNAKNIYGQTPLTCALSNYRMEIAKFLISKGARIDIPSSNKVMIDIGVSVDIPTYNEQMKSKGIKIDNPSKMAVLINIPDDWVAIFDNQDLLNGPKYMRGTGDTKEGPSISSDNPRSLNVRDFAYVDPGIHSFIMHFHQSVENEIKFTAEPGHIYLIRNIKNNPTDKYKKPDIEEFNLNK